MSSEVTDKDAPAPSSSQTQWKVLNVEPIGWRSVKVSISFIVGKKKSLPFLATASLAICLSMTTCIRRPIVG
jgi:hypothetical protein